LGFEGFSNQLAYKVFTESTFLNLKPISGHFYSGFLPAFVLNPVIFMGFSNMKIKSQESLVIILY